jgi:UDP-glucose 4-epimerase
MADRVVLVTGATGAVGPQVVRACQATGYSVRTLSVDAPDRNVLPPGVDARLGDVCDRDAVESAVAGVDAVVHLAALLHQFENVAGLDRQYERVNIGGTENIVRAAVASNVKRLVFLSTIAVYGRSLGHLINENTPPRPDTIYGRTKLAAEHAVLTATCGGEPIGTVLRAAAAYGPRFKGNYRRLAVAIARRRFVRLGACANRRTIVHDRDLANAVVLAAGHPSAAGVIFNVSDGRVHTLAEIINAIYRAVGRSPSRFYVPLAAARVATSACESTCRVIGLRPPITNTLLEKYTEDIAVDGTRIQRALGFAPSVELEHGWQETMTALQNAQA